MRFKKRVIELAPEDMEYIYDLIELHKREAPIFEIFTGYDSAVYFNGQNIKGYCKAKDIKDQFTKLKTCIT